jgi:competence protein ComEC
MNALKFLPKNISFGFGAVGIILFTMLSGGGASAVRAAIMVLVALFAKRFNRDYKANRVLGFTIVLMLAPNPLLLVFDPSFQLSVLATIGLIFVSPILEPYFKNVTEKFGLREILSTTIATQITVLPFLIYNTGIVSFVSIPVNVLILGTIPLTMFLGFITGIFGLVSFYLSIIPAVFTYALLWYQLKIVHLGSSLSFGAVTLLVFSPVYLIFIYGIIFTIMNRLKSKN